MSHLPHFGGVSVTNNLFEFIFYYKKFMSVGYAIFWLITKHIHLNIQEFW